jgi:hypothetical protein
MVKRTRVHLWFIRAHIHDGSLPVLLSTVSRSLCGREGEDLKGGWDGMAMVERLVWVGGSGRNGCEA